MNSGIYQILNVINNKRYIGSAINIDRRWYEHRSDFKKGKNSSHLQNSYNKYGKENFEFSVIEYVEDENSLIEREQYWIDTLKVTDRNKGYNICPTAGSTLGFKYSEKTREGMSERMSGENNPMYGKTGKDCPSYGIHPSDETKKKMSEAQLGEKNHMYGRKGKDCPLYGRERSEDTKKKISNARMGKYVGKDSPRSKMITFNGKTQNISAWAKDIGIHRTSLGQRLSSGWPVEEALTIPGKGVR